MKSPQPDPSVDLRRRKIIFEALRRFSKDFPRLSITEIALALTRCRARRDVMNAVRRSLELMSEERERAAASAAAAKQHVSSSIRSSCPGAVIAFDARGPSAGSAEAAS